jgi:hypothetical protein
MDGWMDGWMDGRMDGWMDGTKSLTWSFYKSRFSYFLLLVSSSVNAFTGLFWGSCNITLISIDLLILDSKNVIGHFVAQLELYFLLFTVSL